MRKLWFVLVTSLALVVGLGGVMSPAAAVTKTCADLLAGQAFACQLSDGSEPFLMAFNPDFSGVPTAQFGNQLLLCGCLSTGTLAMPHPGASKSFVCGYTVPNTGLGVLLSGKVNSTGTKITGSTVGDRSLNHLIKDLVTCTHL